MYTAVIVFSAPLLVIAIGDLGSPYGYATLNGAVVNVRSIRSTHIYQAARIKGLRKLTHI